MFAEVVFSRASVITSCSLTRGDVDGVGMRDNPQLITIRLTFGFIRDRRRFDYVGVFHTLDTLTSSIHQQVGEAFNRDYSHGVISSHRSLFVNFKSDLSPVSCDVLASFS